jgi:hypothetical protein
MRKSKHSKPYKIKSEGRAKSSSKMSMQQGHTRRNFEAREIEQADPLANIRQENQAKLDAIQGEMKPIRATTQYHMNKIRGSVDGYVPPPPLTDYVFYDISDLSTLFQDDAGLVPVTADGQEVRLVLDTSPNGLDLRIPTIIATISPPIYRTDGTLHWLQSPVGSAGENNKMLETATLTLNFAPFMTAFSAVEFITGTSTGNIPTFGFSKVSGNTGNYSYNTMRNAGGGLLQSIRRGNNFDPQIGSQILFFASGVTVDVPFVMGMVTDDQGMALWEGGNEIARDDALPWPADAEDLNPTISSVAVFCGESGGFSRFYGGVALDRVATPDELVAINNALLALITP